jgi:hypothetical protein
MIRKQLYITERQQDLISKLKEKLGVPESEIVRRMIDIGIDEIKRELEKELVK